MGLHPNSQVLQVRFRDERFWASASHSQEKRTQESVLITQLCSTLYDPRACDPQAPLSMGFSRQDAAAGSHSLLQGISTTQGSNPGFLDCRQILYHLRHQESLNNRVVKYKVSLVLSTVMKSLGFPCGSGGKESTCNTGDLGSIPGLGRSPGEGNGYPLQYSGLENSMDCTVHGVSRTELFSLSLSFNEGTNHCCHWPSTYPERSFRQRWGRRAPCALRRHRQNRQIHSGQSFMGPISDIFSISVCKGLHAGRGLCVLTYMPHSTCLKNGAKINKTTSCCSQE